VLADIETNPGSDRVRKREFRTGGKTAWSVRVWERGDEVAIVWMLKADEPDRPSILGIVNA